MGTHRTKAKAPRRKWRASALVMTVIIAAAPVSGCSVFQRGGASQATLPQDGTIRQTSVTAPADLQLLCASEGANQLQVEGGMLPVSSQQLPDGTFEVNLAAGETQAVCVIDQNGTIVRVAATAPDPAAGAVAEGDSQTGQGTL